MSNARAPAGRWCTAQLVQAFQQLYSMAYHAGRTTIFFPPHTETVEARRNTISVHKYRHKRVGRCGAHAVRPDAASARPLEFEDGGDYGVVPPATRGGGRRGRGGEGEHGAAVAAAVRRRRRTPEVCPWSRAVGWPTAAPGRLAPHRHRHHWPGCPRRRRCGVARPSREIRQASSSAARRRAGRSAPLGRR